MKYNIYYDQTCLFCEKCMQWIQKRDRKQSFAFYPLIEEKALSFILEVKNHKYQKGKALFGVFWYLGRGYAFLGILHFLPSICIDWIYKIFAKIKNKKCQ